MEVGFLENGIRNILIDEYKIAEPRLVIKFHDFIKAVLDTQSFNKDMDIMQEHANRARDYEARKIALEAAVKTYHQTGGDLTENAIKYKRFLLKETVNEN